MEVQTTRAKQKPNETGTSSKYGEAPPLESGFKRIWFRERKVGIGERFFFKDVHKDTKKKVTDKEGATSEVALWEIYSRKLGKDGSLVVDCEG